MKGLEVLESLPITNAEKEEIVAAYERRNSTYWVNAREEIKQLCEERLAKKTEIKVAFLLKNERATILRVDEHLKSYVEELWGLNYSAAAISRALNYAVCSGYITDTLFDLGCKKRGQVIELLNDFDAEFNFKAWQIKNQKNCRTGSAVTEAEKLEFIKLYSKGFSFGEIANITGRSKKAVGKWVKQYGSK